MQDPTTAPQCDVKLAFGTSMIFVSVFLPMMYSYLPFSRLVRPETLISSYLACINSQLNHSYGIPSASGDPIPPYKSIE